MSMQTRVAPDGARLTCWLALIGLCAGSFSAAADAQGVAMRVAPCRQKEVYGWVAELPKTFADCPEPSTKWRLRRFPLDDTSKRMLCSYEWRSSAAPTKAGLPKGLDYSADCMAIGVSQKERPFVPQPESPTDADLAAVEDDFLDAIDAPIQPVRARRDSKDPRPRLAFIDALPVAAEGPQQGAIQHGNSLRTLARLVAGCSDRACPFEYGWYGEPALFPYSDGEVVGSALDSAAALLSTLDHHRSSPAEHLVLSLGLGFEADARCASLPDSPVVQALREAIRRVACEADAIVLAPVGNARHDDVTTGMLYPAAFASEELQCDGVLQGRPLVVAISGVDHQLRPLRSSRAHARLMTVGGPFAHQGDEPEDQLNPRTASSVAVAAAAPLITVAWLLRPTLSASAMMAALDPPGDAVSGSRVMLACDTWERLCTETDAGRCAELVELCGEPSVHSGSPFVVETKRSELPSPGTIEPTVCVGRGQRPTRTDPGD